MQCLVQPRCIGFQVTIMDVGPETTPLSNTEHRTIEPFGIPNSGYAETGQPISATTKNIVMNLSNNIA